jgi:hypothetical protein
MILGTLYAPKKKHDSRKKIRTIEGLGSYGFQGIFVVLTYPLSLRILISSSLLMAASTSFS